MSFGLTLFLGAMQIRGDDSFPPCWRGNSGTTYQSWTFNASNNPATPDQFANSNGVPQATLVVGAFGTGWIGSTFGGRTGVWDLGKAGQVNLAIPNFGGAANSWKYVQVQVTYFQDSLAYAAPTISIAGATLVSSQVINNQSAPPGNWKTMQSVWLITPSPNSETVVVNGSASKGLLIDQIIVDTRSPSADDPVPQYGPCWRGLAGSTFQQWAFGVSNNPAAIPAELVTNAYGTPSASIVLGAFSDGYIEEDPFFGCVQGIWDLGQNGTLTLNLPNRPSGSTNSYKYVQVEVTQFQDGGIYSTNAVVSIAGGARVSQQQQVTVTNDYGGEWVVEKTVWRLVPSPGSEAVVITGGTNGALIDQVVVDTLSLDFTWPADITVNADAGQCSKSNVTWTVPAVDGCVVTNVVSTPPSGSTFAGGTNLVTYVVKDGEGGTKTFHFNVIVLDTQPPVIGTITALEGAVDVQNCANTTLQGAVSIAVQASDNCSLAGGHPTITLTNGLATDAATFVNQSPVGTFNYVWNVTNATANGTWNVTVSAADLNNNITNASFTLCVNKTQITGQVQLDSFVGTATVPPHTRAVTFVASTNWMVGSVTNTIYLLTNTLTLTFTGSTAPYTLTGLPANVNGLSAKTAWNLRRKLTVALDANNQAVVNFTGASLLRGGDLDGNNIVNVGDYNILSLNWFQVAPVADINGDGIVNVGDYNILGLNWFILGDPQ
jgi:hypothetical protein